MKLLFKVSSILLLAVASKADIQEAFIAHGLVPDLIPLPPAAEAMVIFPSGAIVAGGNELRLSQLQEVPQVTWEADADKFYTLAMIDPDPSNPALRDVQHWLVVNIPGNNVDAGEVLSEFFGPGAPQGTGLHRYTFLVYEQPSEQEFDERRLSADIIIVEDRVLFSITNFAEKYSLGNPIAGNFLLAQHEE